MKIQPSPSPPFALLILKNYYLFQYYTLSHPCPPCCRDMVRYHQLIRIGLSWQCRYLWLIWYAVRARPLRLGRLLHHGRLCRGLGGHRRLSLKLVTLNSRLGTILPAATTLQDTSALTYVTIVKQPFYSNLSISSVNLKCR